MKISPRQKLHKEGLWRVQVWKQWRRWRWSWSYPSSFGCVCTARSRPPRLCPTAMLCTGTAPTPGKCQALPTMCVYVSHRLQTGTRATNSMRNVTLDIGFMLVGTTTLGEISEHLEIYGVGLSWTSFRILDHCNPWFISCRQVQKTGV